MAARSANGAFASIVRVHDGGVGGITADHIASLEDGARQCACNDPLVAHETSADGEHAADTIGEFAGEVRQNLVELAILEPEIGARIIVGERLHLALLDGKRKQIEPGTDAIRRP